MLGQSGEYDLCSVRPDLSLEDVNLQRKHHHLLASDIPAKARALMVCPAFSDFDEFDGECKCRAGLYMQYTDITELVPLRCVICAAGNGLYPVGGVVIPNTEVGQSSPEPAMDPLNRGYFCPPGSKESIVLSTDPTISQRCRFDDYT